MARRTKIFLSTLFVAAACCIVSYFIPETNIKGQAETGEDDGKIPLKSRMDLAWEHEFNITKDPLTNTVPKERLLTAMAEIRSRFSGEHSSKVLGAIPGINWTERGPNNVGGRTRAILVDPNDLTKRKVWTAGIGGGLWYTADITVATPVWNKVNDLFPNIAISCIVYKPSNTLEMYFGTGEGFYNADAQRGLGLWKTTDGGATWNQLSSTNNSNFYHVQRLAVHPISGDIYAATRTGLYRSQNGGTTWVQVLGAGNGSNSNSMADVEIAADNSIWVGVGLYLATDGVYRSASGNTGTWSRLNTGANGFPTTNIQRIEIACAPNNAATVYVMTQGGGNGIGGIYRTTNTGANWTSLPLPADADPGVGGDMTRGQAWYDLTIAVDPNNSNTVLVGGIDLFKSTNSGNNWQQIAHWYGGFGFQEVHADQHWIYFEPGNSSVIYFGNDGGIWRTTNGTAAVPAITSKNFGYNVTQFYACAMHPTAYSDYFLAGAQDNGSQQFTKPGVNSTTEVTGGDGCFMHIDQNQPQYQFTTYVYNNFFRSSDCGQSWTSIGFTGGSFVTPCDYDNTGNIMYMANAGGSYRRWTNPQTGNTSAPVNIPEFNNRNIQHVSVSQNTTHTVFFGTDQGRVVRVDNANTIASGAAGNWINNGSGMPASNISCIAVQNGNDNHLLVTYSNYGVNSIWETTNGGTSWTSVEGNLPDMPVRWALFNPSNNAQAIIATELGVWSTDLLSGATTNWGPSNTGFANTRVDMLQIRSSDNLVAAATHGRGLYTTDAFCSPNPEFKSDNMVSYTGANISFEDASFKATSWSWNFGDGFTSTLKNPVHTYNVAGSYNVSLTINGTLTVTKNNYIRILPNRGTPYTPAAGGNFDVNPNDFAAEINSAALACATAVTNFERGNSAVAGKSGTRSGSFAWVTGLTQANYANNTTAKLFSPNYNFSAAGAYTLRMYRKNQFEIGWDGMIVEYSLNRGLNWIPLGAQAAGWYDFTVGGTTAFPPNQPFFNSTQAGFNLCQWDVSALAGNLSVSFRMTFKSDVSATAPGIAIDDFEVTGPTNSPLPVELISFTGEPLETHNLLLWKTASELLNEGFEVLKSNNGLDFKKIGFVKGNGTTTQLKSYEFIDEKINDAIAYYRLRQIDFNGNFKYSETIAIKRKSTFFVEFIYPNPFTDEINAVLNIVNQVPVSVRIMDVSGKTVLNKQLTPQDYQLKISTRDYALAPGTYFMQITLGEEQYTQKIFKK